MAAFDHARSLGYRYLETDVHVTADGALVAFHDPDLSRVSDRSGIISELTAAEVAQARIEAPDGSVHTIPLFDEVATAWPDARINIDPKSDEAVEPLIAAVRRADLLDRICIGSFSDARLERCRQSLGPGLCTSMGPREIAQLRAASFRLPTRAFRSQCAQVPTSWKGRTLVDARFLRVAHRHELDVHVWTVNNIHEMRRLLDLGVDGLMTDATKVLADLLTSRQSWPSV